MIDCQEIGETHGSRTLLCDFGPIICSWTIRTLWSRTINNLEEYLKHTAPGAVLISNMVLEHI